MKETSQRRLVMTLSVGATMLILGVGLGLLLARPTNDQTVAGGNPVAQEAAGGADDRKKSPADAPGKPRRPAAMVRVGTVTREAITPLKPLVGQLVEVRRSTIASEVDGKVVEMPVEVGTRVVEGETVLAKIDDVWRRMAIDQIEAQIASTDASLAFEKSEAERLAELLELDATSRSDFEGCQARLNKLEADRQRYQSQLDEEHEKLARSTILAPFDGSVIAKHADLGSHVTVGKPLVDIVSSGRIDARMMVPESIVELLDLQQEIDVLIDPLGAEFRGRVVAITAFGSTASRTFPVRVALDDDGGRLKVGMSITAFVPMAARSTEMVVPKDAVLTEPDGSTVWLVTPAQRQEGAPQTSDTTPATMVEPIPVRLKARMRDVYAITPLTEKGQETLVPGASVVIEGAERLVPGMSVRIDDREVSLEAIPGMYETGQQKVDR